jgi:hypothetical protein
VSVEIEQQLRAGPAAHGLYPLEVRPPRQMKAGEGVPQPMRRELTGWAESLLGDAAEHAIPEVVRVDDTPGLIGEDEGFFPDDVRPKPCEDFPKAG